MNSNFTVVITGAAGNIGQKIRTHLKDRYSLRLLDLVSTEKEVISLDLSQWSDELLDSFTGVDAVVHLAADPFADKTWQELLPSNLDAMNNVFVAAIKAKVPRVVFASSNHVMGGYADVDKPGRWLDTTLPPKPGTRVASASGQPRDSTAYAAMKLFGERLGKCYAQSTGGVCIAIRIGWVYRMGDNSPEDLPKDANPWFRKMWLSTSDLCQLVEKAIVEPKPPKSFLVVNGMSDNAGMVWDIDETKVCLNYLPADGLSG